MVLMFLELCNIILKTFNYLNINCAGKSKIGDRPLNLPNTQADNVDIALLKKRNTVNTLLGYKLQ